MRKIRTVVCGGGPRGVAAVKVVADSKLLTLVGGVPDRPRIDRSQENRFWKFPQFDPLRESFSEAVENTGKPCYRGPILTDENRFVEWLEHLKPDLLLTACFGYRLTLRVLSAVPGRWCVNFHPVAAGSPWRHGQHPYAGYNPWELMVRDKVEQAELLAHVMTSNFDRGKELARSAEVPLPEIPGEAPDLGALVFQMHEAMASHTAELVQRLAPHLAWGIGQSLSLEDSHRRETVRLLRERIHSTGYG